MADPPPKMVFLGFGKYARADRIYALEPITDERRGSGRRTLVWVDGIAEPIVASRTERTILLDMGQRDAVRSQVLDQALALAERVVADADKVGSLIRRSIKAEAGVDLDELARRARRLLEATASPPGAQSLFEGVRQPAVRAETRPRRASRAGASSRAASTRSLPLLIGCTLLVDGVGGRIVEVEAYDPTDPASHAFAGQTVRNRTMFGPPGHVYVYRSYGIHWCMNLVCEAAGRQRRASPGARADARARGRWRSGADVSTPGLLCAGPGRLCQALAVTGTHDGLALDEPPFVLLATPDPVEIVARTANRHHARDRAALALRPCRISLRQQGVQRVRATSSAASEPPGVAAYDDAERRRREGGAPAPGGRGLERLQRLGARARRRGTLPSCLRDDS